MTWLVCLGSAALLVWLGRARFGRGAVVASIAALPLLVLVSPSRIELAATILVEAPIVVALAGLFGVRRGAALLASCLVNVVTQPLLYFALHALPATSVAAWRLAFATGELAVWIAEALLYLACLDDLRTARHALPKALAISLAANGASAFVGLVLPI